MTLAALWMSTITCAFLISLSALGAQQVQRRLITNNTDDMQRVALRGNVRSEVTTEHLLGGRDSGAAMLAILVLHRSAENEAEFKAPIDPLHARAYPNLHESLSNTDVRTRFGPSHEDVARASEWLGQKGLPVNQISSPASPAKTAQGESPRTAPNSSSTPRTTIDDHDHFPRLVPVLLVRARPQPRPAPLAADASPQAIFDRLSNTLEKQFYKESTPNQRRVILEHFADRFHRIVAGDPFMYDDWDENLSSEMMFKALAYPELLDVYNLAQPHEQCAMGAHGYARWIEFEMGIKLSLEQEERAAQARAVSHTCR